MTDIIKDDSQSQINQVKDIAVEILLQIKIILFSEPDKNLIEKFNALISKLPNFRYNMINKGRAKSFMENNSERDYKVNLNKIKSNLNFLAIVFLKFTPSLSGYLLKFLESLEYSLIAFGLGPNADSLADNFTLAALFLNLLKPVTYFSAMILFGFGSLILL